MEKTFTYSELRRPENWGSVESIYGDTVVFSPDLFDFWKAVHFEGIACTQSQGDPNGPIPPRWIVTNFQVSGL